MSLSDTRAHSVSKAHAHTNAHKHTRMRKNTHTGTGVRGGRYIDEKLSKADKSIFLKLSATYRYRKMEILILSKNYRYRKVHQILADK